MKASIPLFALALIAGSEPAAAEQCKVRVTVAPDEVKPVIEAWVRAEPTCRHDLEVRVVATQDGGYYLYARDAVGRVRERVVPDAVAVGVLVASWIADDALPIVRAPIPAIDIAPLAPREREPGVPTIQPGGVSITVGAITSLAKGYGMRAEAQWASRGGWLLYGAASIGRTGMYYSFGNGGVELYPTDTRIAAGVGRAWTGARWGARLRVGLVRAKWSGEFGDVMLENTTFEGVETGVRVTRRISDRWSVIGGLDVNKLVVSGWSDSPSGATPEPISITNAPAFEVAAIAGLDVRL